MRQKGAVPVQNLDVAAVHRGPSPLRILLVGDDSDDAESIGLELERAGWRVLSERVQDRDEMVAALGRTTFDIVISDYHLPRLRAPEALAVCKERELDIPFIVCSGAIGEEEAVEVVRAGASDFVLKGRWARLSAAVARELRTAESRRALGQGRSAGEHAIETLARSEQLFHDLFESAPEATFILTSNALVRAANERAGSLFGWSTVEMIGQPFARFVPSFGPALHAVRLATDAGDGGSAGPAFEGEGLRRGGDTFPVEVSLGRLARDGELMVASVHDLTDRRRLEDQLRQTQKMEAIGRLASGVAHDFNNILGVVIGNSQLLMKDPNAGERARARGEQILLASERGVGLTRQLLAFSRRDTSGESTLDFNETVERIASLLARLLGEDITFEFRRNDPLGLVRANRTELEQILMNLAVNARDAMAGGGRLVVETSNEIVDHAYLRAHVDAAPGNYVCVSVSDTGHGMTREIQERVFEPFFTTKPEGKGTGLGLATVYSIVKRNRGFVHLYSEVGHGTTFRVYLPLVIGDPERPAAASAPAKGAETLLVVEDDPALSELIRELLQENGYRVLVASSPQEALAVAGRHEGALDLLVTDIVMPGMNGKELAGRLRETCPRLRVLYMSGYTEDIVGQRGLLDGASVFLAKPFTEEALTQSVRRAIGAPPVGDP
jgi:two-component system, cell cycle sensor histidine kinase and response regulator CckA